MDPVSRTVDPDAALASTQQPNPATVEALLDITWRMVDAEDSRREGVNQKASSLATFTSLVLSLTATLGGEFLQLDEGWALGLYLASLLVLAAALAVAIVVLLPRRRQTLSTAYLDRFPTWAEILKEPAHVRGEAMQGLIATLKADRELNHRNAGRLFLGFALLFLGLCLVAVEAAAIALVGVA